MNPIIVTTEKIIGIIITSLTGGKFITIVDKRGNKYNGKHKYSFKNSFTIKRPNKQNYIINISIIKEVRMDKLIYQIQ